MIPLQLFLLYIQPSKLLVHHVFHKTKCWGSQKAWGIDSPDKYVDKIGNELSEDDGSLPYVSISDGTALIDKISCGSYSLCVKYDSGALKCLGWNIFGQIGIGLPINFVGETSGHINDGVLAVNLGTGLLAIDVTNGARHTCVKVTGNKVKGFGRNDRENLGYGDIVNRGKGIYGIVENLTTVDLGTGVEAGSVVSGSSSPRTSVILSAPSGSQQRVKCWGYNSGLSLGYGNTYPGDRGDDPEEVGDYLPLLNLGTESTVKKLALGDGHICALLINDGLKCFGGSINGQLSSGSASTISSTGDNMPFVQIDSGKKVKLLSTGLYHTCIVYDDDITAKSLAIMA